MFDRLEDKSKGMLEVSSKSQQQHPADSFGGWLIQNTWHVFSDLRDMRFAKDNTPSREKAKVGKP